MKILPLFNWLTERGTGVLLHPTCFPGDQGVGTLDHSARLFIDFLEKSGITHWQVCPLGPTGFGDSPYQTFSAFAGNPYLIDLKIMVGIGLLSDADLEPFRFMPSSRTDFGLLYQTKWLVLQKAFHSFQEQAPKHKLTEEFNSFRIKQEKWLKPFGLFMALKEKFEGRSWLEWPNAFRSFKSLSDKDLELEVIKSAESHEFYQFLFFKQWSELKQYANGKGIQIIGDIPIFVSLDSVDVWCDPEYFQIDKKTGKPKAMAGCPPDYFAKDGQFWGNPLYEWKAMKADGYSWWIDRFESSFQLYDVVRIDHFRGFEAYWSIPAKAKTAAEGKWVKGPGLAVFKTIKEKLPKAKIIAEDLGHITPEVSDLLADTGLPGMAVLQFAFGGSSDNFYLPHNLKENSVIYPGTHDNDTSISWYETSGDVIQDHVRRYYDVDGQNVGWDFIRSCYRSVSKLAVIPLQDLMSLDGSARMNEPGNALGNWQWRYQTWQLEALMNESSDYLASLAKLNGR